MSAEDGVGLNPSGGSNANLTRLGIARARVNGCRRASVIGAACSHAERTVDDQGRDSRPAERRGSGNWGDQNKEATRSEFIVKKTIISQAW
jgi:hypothetical protein